MHIEKQNKREQIHALRVAQIRSDIIKKVSNIRVKTEEWRSETIKKRSENIENVRRNLRKTSSLIQERHDMIRKRISEEAIHKDVNIRVNRGLEALEKFIPILRETNTWQDVMERAVYDPVVSRTIKSEARKAIASDFFKAIQRQAIMQTEFINIAAHELRTPIMPIIMNAEMLKEEVGETEEVKTILRNAKRLKRLTENILNVTRIESNTLKLNIENLEINDIIKEIIQEEKIQLPREIKFDFISSQKQIYIDADRERITQVIFNIINNAIKFTKDIIVIRSEIQDYCVKISIEDNGKGIDPKIFPVLFSKFATKSYRGTGLGMYISKAILEAHGGTISASNLSEPPKGAKFTFMVPLIHKKVLGKNKTPVLK